MLANIFQDVSDLSEEEEEEEECDDEAQVDRDTLLHAFAGSKRILDEVDEVDGNEFFDKENCLPNCKNHRAREPIPWEIAAVFEGERCAARARESMPEHAGSQWFDSKGLVLRPFS